MDLSNYWLFIYSAAWLITFIVYQRKKKIFDTGSIIILSYFIYSLLSFYLYNHSRTYHPMHLFPFIYLYLMVMLALTPVIKYDHSKTPIIQKPTDTSINNFCIVYIIASFFWIISVLFSLINGISNILSDSSAGLDIYNEAAIRAENSNLGDGKISNLPAVLTSVMSDIGILLFFYMLSLKKRKKFIMIGLFISILVSILYPISQSQRGPGIDRAFACITALSVFYYTYSDKAKKYIRVGAIVMAALIALPIVAITISRFGDSYGGTQSSVISYAGMQNLNFNNYGLDNGGIRYGDRTVSLFKRMLGFQNVPNNFFERWEKYPNLYINDYVFIGFVGDFTLDFGPFIPPFIFLFFTLFIIGKTKTRDGTILFHQLILLFFVMNVCMNGGLKLFPYSDTNNLIIIMYLLAYWYFKFDYQNQQKKIGK